MLYKLQLGTLRADGQIERLTVPLALALSTGGSASPTYPIAVVGLEVSTSALSIEDETQFDLVGLHASAAAEGDAWANIPLEPASGRWQLDLTSLVSVLRSPSLEPLPPRADSALSVRFSTGAVGLPTAFPITYSFRLAGSTFPEALPILVDERLLRCLAPTSAQGYR